MEKKKRIRHAVKAEELGHLFVHQVQSEGWEIGGKNRFYFEGDTIYSYGPHFPIAKVLPKKNMILVSYRHWSGGWGTTSGHQAVVSRAIPKSMKRVSVYRPDYPLRYNIDHEITKAMQRLEDSRKPRIREHSIVGFIRSALYRLERAREIIRALEPKRNPDKYILSVASAQQGKEIRMLFDPAFLKEFAKRAKKSDKIQKAAQDKRDAECNEKYKAQRLAYEAAERRRAANKAEAIPKAESMFAELAPLYLPKWFAGEINAYDDLLPEEGEYGSVSYYIREKLSGLFYDKFHKDTGNLLRVSKKHPGEVETDNYANAPLEGVRMLYLAYKAGKPIHGEKIAGFPVLRADSKEVEIGCHLFKITEINRFAQSQGWK